MIPNESLDGADAILPKRFLMAVWEGGGTLPPEMEVARKLIARGHQVKVIGVIAQAAGVRLKPAAKPAQIRKAIHTVLDGRHRGAAERLAAAIAEESRTLDVARDIEVLAGAGSSSRPARATRRMHAARN